MADYVNAKFDAEKNLAPLEIMSMTGEQFAWITKVVGISGYREVQRGLRERGECSCCMCAMIVWKRANATIAKIANVKMAAEGKRGKV